MVGLTGTLLGGYADDLFNTLFRLEAESQHCHQQRKHSTSHCSGCEQRSVGRTAGRNRYQLAAPIHLNHLLIPPMLKHGRPGSIINVTSGGAFVPQVFAPSYGACQGRSSQLHVDVETCAQPLL
jgi:NAD(P)-dependent dehydrogenase (short-subunit alcohol dehydrogenase family)